VSSKKSLQLSYFNSLSNEIRSLVIIVEMEPKAHDSARVSKGMPNGAENAPCVLYLAQLIHNSLAL
jgi:hypothetical protein